MLKYYLILLTAVLLFSSITFIFYKFKKEKFDLYLKIVSIIIAVCLIFRYFWDDLYLESLINPSEVLGFSSRGDLIFAVILHWVEVVAIFMIILYPFFSNVKTLKILSGFVAPLIFLLSVIFFNKLSIAYFGPSVSDETSIRAIFLSLEVGFG